jgi:hypothetical protein
MADSKPPSDYDRAIDAAVEAMLISCRAGGDDAALAEVTRATMHALEIRTGRCDAFHQAEIDAVNADFQVRLLVRLGDAIGKGAAELAGISNVRIMEQALKKILFSDSIKLT